MHVARNQTRLPPYLHRKLKLFRRTSAPRAFDTVSEPGPRSSFLFLSAETRCYELRDRFCRVLCLPNVLGRPTQGSRSGEGVSGHLDVPLNLCVSISIWKSPGDGHLNHVIATEGKATELWGFCGVTRVWSLKSVAKVICILHVFI